MAELTMPRLSDTMEEGTIGRWLKQPGDQVQKGDILLEIETDKATMELESYDSGTLQKILVQEGQTVPIGETIAIIGEGEAEPVGTTATGPSNESAAVTESQPTHAEPRAAMPTDEGGSDAVARTTQPPSEAQGMHRSPASQVPGNGHAVEDRIIASPVARRLAEEYGIDLRQVEGTGPGGRIIKENVEALYQQHQTTPAPAAAPPKPAPSPKKAEPAELAAPRPAPAPKPAAAPAPTAATQPIGEIVPMTRMRRAIARRMTEAKPGIPHIYVTTEVDMADALQWRAQINESGVAPVKISVNDLVIKATAKALRAFPVVNSSYAAGSDGQPGFVQHAQINISVAIAIAEGLMAPAVIDADKKSLGIIAAEVKELATRAREGKIKPNELEGGTFTVSNLGMYDVVEFGMIITPPQSAALAVGAVRKVPVVRDDEIVPGEMMRITVSVDHRIVDGATAAQFLQELKRLLESPLSLLV